MRRRRMDKKEERKDKRKKKGKKEGKGKKEKKKRSIRDISPFTCTREALLPNVSPKWLQLLHRICFTGTAAVTAATATTEPHQTQP